MMSREKVKPNIFIRNIVIYEWPCNYIPNVPMFINNIAVWEVLNRLTLTLFIEKVGLVLIC